MAKHRLVNSEVVTCDRVLKLPHRIQLLYIHLIVEGADDEGFVGSPIGICRRNKMHQTAIDTLVDAGLLIRFESGVVLITDWPKHNKLRPNFIKHTEFRQEAEQVILDREAAVYRLREASERVPQTDRESAQGQEEEAHHTTEATQSNATQSNTTQSNTTQSNTTQSNTTQYNTTQRSETQPKFSARKEGEERKEAQDNSQTAREHAAPASFSSCPPIPSNAEAEATAAAGAEATAAAGAEATAAAGAEATATAAQAHDSAQTAREHAAPSSLPSYLQHPQAFQEETRKENHSDDSWESLVKRVQTPVTRADKADTTRVQAPVTRADKADTAQRQAPVGRMNTADTTRVQTPAGRMYTADTTRTQDKPLIPSLEVLTEQMTLFGVKGITAQAFYDYWEARGWRYENGKPMQLATELANARDRIKRGEPPFPDLAEWHTDGGDSPF